MFKLLTTFTNTVFSTEKILSIITNTSIALILFHSEPEEEQEIFGMYHFKKHDHGIHSAKHHFWTFLHFSKLQPGPPAQRYVYRTFECPESAFTHTSVKITSTAKDYGFLQILDRSDLCGVHMVFTALPEEGVRRC